MNFLLRLSGVRSDFALILGSLNPALNNWAKNIKFVVEREPNYDFAMSSWSKFWGYWGNEHFELNYITSDPQV